MVILFSLNTWGNSTWSLMVRCAQAIYHLRYGRVSGRYGPLYDSTSVGLLVMAVKSSFGMTNGWEIRPSQMCPLSVNNFWCLEGYSFWFYWGWVLGAASPPLWFSSNCLELGLLTTLVSCYLGYLHVGSKSIGLVRGILDLECGETLQIPSSLVLIGLPPEPSPPSIIFWMAVVS